MHQIELRNTTIEYDSVENPVTALQDVSFSVEPAEFLCVARRERLRQNDDAQYRRRFP